jgi:hypothetical protein
LQHLLNKAPWISNATKEAHNAHLTSRWPPAKKPIDLVKDGVRKAFRNRQVALSELVDSFCQYRRLADKTPLTLQGSDYVHTVQGLDKALTEPKD